MKSKKVIFLPRKIIFSATKIRIYLLFGRLLSEKEKFSVYRCPKNFFTPGKVEKTGIFCNICS